MSKYDVALFDLDGTLSKSAEGIKFTMTKTLERCKIEPFDLEDYTIYIGPPLYNTFKNICHMTDEENYKAIEVYRDIYEEEGKYINGLFDGITDMLQKVKDSGTKIVVATSKYEKHAVEIVDKLGLLPYVDYVCGAMLDGSRKDKKDIIPFAVKTAGFTMNDKIVMIGDTYFDCDGAVSCGVDFVGVTYGYGDLEAMKKSGGRSFADTPMEILDYIL